MVNILVNGIGAIGKRVAHAVRLQDDMQLVGISDAAPTFVLRTNLEENAPLYKTDCYVSDEKFIKNFETQGFYCKGLLKDALESGKVDVVVDCTPAGIEEFNKALYNKYNVKVIYQGGAKESVAEMSFNSDYNYEKAAGRKSLRVVSCNTTSLIRTINAIDKDIGIDEVTASLVRRGVDPWDSSKGPINSIVPVLSVPSHHGPDVKSVMHELNINTMAVKVPSTLAHVHMVHAKVKRNTNTQEIRDIFSKNPRIILLKGSHGFVSTSEVMERFKDLLKSRGDMPEVVIWDETISANGRDIYWMHMVHSESIVVPENIDAIRAITGIEKDFRKSIERTNKSLGIQ